jgi:hypothetical protein
LNAGTNNTDCKKTIYEYLGSKFRKMRAIDKEDRACIKSNDEGD